MFINVATQAYPLSYEDIKKTNQHISFTTTMNLEFLSSIGYEPVKISPYPTGLKLHQYATLQPPAFNGTEWVQEFIVEDYVFTGLTDVNNQPIDPVVAETHFVEHTKRQLRAQLARYRYIVETGGIEVNGVFVMTDRTSQSSIIGAHIRSQINPFATVDWKGVDGWVQLNNAAITAMSTAVLNHVQACFSKERTLSEALDALTLEQLSSFNVHAEWQLI